MSDILERLRKVDSGPTRQPGVTTNWHRNPDGPEAADEIERLRARLAAWERRFPQYEYRPQDDCVALRLTDSA